jgi:fumarate hydratase subunit alpha
MKTVPYKKLVDRVRALCLTAAFDLPADAARSLAAARRREKAPVGKKLLGRILLNARIAREARVPICQDTGIAAFFVELGSGVRITGGTLADAINEGTARGYAEGFLRPSMVSDPLFARKNTFTNAPAVIHVSCVKGDSLTVTLAPKGGGSENMTRLFMLKPADGEAGVIDAAVTAAVQAGGNPCPPVVVGVGIGGTAETALLLSKKALVRPLGKKNPDKRYAALERKILETINNSGVGPGGLGGTVTALGVRIETFPCHIATLPVAVSLSCHAARHASVTL